MWRLCSSLAPARTRRTFIGIATLLFIAYVILNILAPHTRRSLVLRLDRESTSVKAAQHEDFCPHFSVVISLKTPEHTREAAILLKSILFHTNVYLSLDLFGTNSTCITMNHLLYTWNIPTVQFVCQDLHNLKQNKDYITSTLSIISWIIKNKQIYPKVLFLDPSARLLDDISTLWNKFPVHKTGITGNNLTMMIEPGRLQETSLDVIESYIKQMKSQHHQDQKVCSCSWGCAMESSKHVSPCIRGVLPIHIYKPGILLDKYSNEEHIEIIRQHEKTIRELDGETFRYKATCERRKYSHSEKIKDHNDSCAEYISAGVVPRRTHFNFLGPILISYTSRFRVTLATQFTLDRFSSFERLIDNWAGPVSAVLYGSDAEANQLIELCKKSKICKKHKNMVHIHLVYRRGPHYPINQLRNIALKYIHTPFLLFVDVDLITNPNLSTTINPYLPIITNTMLLVVPAFEGYETLKTFPENKSDMLTVMAAGHVDGYHQKKGWKAGHVATDYAKWKNATQPYLVKPRCVFEPYVVLKTGIAPEYDERLLERFGDKISYVCVLIDMGYKMKVLHDAFVLHIPHPLSKGTLDWKSNGPMQRCSSILHKRVKKESSEKYIKKDEKIQEIAKNKIGK